MLTREEARVAATRARTYPRGEAGYYVRAPHHCETALEAVMLLLDRPELAPFG